MARSFSPKRRKNERQSVGRYVSRVCFLMQPDRESFAPHSFVRCTHTPGRASRASIGLSLTRTLFDIHRRNCSTRSSIKSCSISQTLSDERRRLSISSARAGLSASTVSGHNAPGRLLDICDVCLEFSIRQPPCLGRVAMNRKCAVLFRCFSKP